MRKDQHTERLERLAHTLADGKMTVREAMLSVGYSATTAKLGRVMHKGDRVSPHNHPVVIDVIDRIQRDARRAVSVTVVDIVQKLERAYEIAVEERQAGFMTQATMGMAKVLGLETKKRPNDLKPIAEMDEEEVTALLGEKPADAVVH